MLWILAVEGGEEHSPLAPQPVEVIVGLIAFGLLYLVLRRALLPRFEKAFQERTEAIEGGLARAEAAQQEAQALLAQYREQLQEARGEAARIRAEAQSERKAIVDQAVGEAREEAQRVSERTHAQLLADLAQARAELSRDLGRLAVDLAGRVVGANLADTDRTRATVDSFIGELETAGAPSGAPGSDAGTPPGGHPGAP
jgi:F-type H+-transporting ATPase subunit b